MITYNLKNWERNRETVKTLCKEEEPDVMMLQETWISQTQASEIDNGIPNYRAVVTSSDYEMTMSKRLEGGIIRQGTALVYENSMAPSTQELPSPSHRISAIRHKDTFDLLFVCVYLPSSNHNIEEWEKELNTLENFITGHRTEETEIVIAGDVNVDGKPTARNRRYFDMIWRLNLEEVRPEEPTFFNVGCAESEGNTLDVMIKSKNVEIISTKVWGEDKETGECTLVENTSDHYPVSWKIKIRKTVLQEERKKQTREEDHYLTKRRRPNWLKTNLHRYKHLVMTYSRIWEEILSDMDVPGKLRILGELIADAALRSQLPNEKKKKEENEAKMESEELERLKRSKVKTCHKMSKERRKKEGTKSTEYKKLCEEKNLVNKNIADENKRLWNKKTEEEQLDFVSTFRGGDPQVIYRRLKKLLGKKINGLPKELVYNGEIYRNSQVAEGFVRWSEDTSCDERWSRLGDYIQHKIDQSVIITSILDTVNKDRIKDLTTEEMTELMKELPRGKAGDLQGLQVEHLLHLPEAVKDIVTKTVNELTDNLEEYSDTLLNCRLGQMLHKGKGRDKSVCCSYRRISYGSIFQKLVDQLLSSHIFKVIKQKQCKRQFGFTAGINIFQCVILREMMIADAEENGKPLYCLAADVSNAFSRTQRQNQLLELERAGEFSKLLQYSKATYTNTNTLLKTKEGFSRLFGESLGSAQGAKKSASDYKSMSNPLISMLVESGLGYELLSEDSDNKYMNEGLADQIRRIPIILVADDSMAFANSEEELKEIAKIYEEYSRQHAVTFCFEKVIVNVYGDKEGLKRLKSEKTLTISGEQPIYAEKSVHLGTLMCEESESTNRLNIESRIKAANKKLFHLLSKLINLKIPISHDIQIKSYSTYIKSTLCVTLQTFPLQERDMKMITDYEKSILRKMFYLRKTSRFQQLYLILGECPAEVKIHRDTFQLFHNIWESRGQTELAKFCLDFLAKDMKRETWPKYIRRLAEWYDITDPEDCLKNPPPDKEVWSNYIAKKIIRWHEENIKRKLNNSSTKKYLNLNERSLTSGPHPICRVSRTKFEIIATNITIQHLLGEYRNNLNKRGNQDKNCPICKEDDIKVRDTTQHNLAGCRKILADGNVIKQLTEVIAKAAAITGIPRHEIIEIYTSDNTTFVQTLLDPYSPNMKEILQLDLISDRSNSELVRQKAENQKDFVRMCQRYVKVCNEV